MSGEIFDLYIYRMVGKQELRIVHRGRLQLLYKGKLLKKMNPLINYNPLNNRCDPKSLLSFTVTHQRLTIYEILAQYMQRST